MRKVLPWRFEERLGPFSMVTVEQCSETWLFKHLANQVARSR